MLEVKKGISQVSVIRHEEAQEERDAPGPTILTPVLLNTLQLI